MKTERQGGGYSNHLKILLYEQKEVNGGMFLYYLKSLTLGLRDNAMNTLDLLSTVYILCM